MSIRFSEEVKNLINKMSNISRKYELEQLNSMVLIAALNGLPQFARTLELSSMSSREEIEDLLDDALDTWYSEGEIKFTDAQNRMFNKLEENNMNAKEMEPFSSGLVEVFEYAELIAEEEKREEITVDDLVCSLLVNQEPDVKTYFREICVDIDGFKEIYIGFVQDISENTVLLPSSLIGFVTVLNNKFKKNSNCAILGRDKECEEIWKTMMKKTKRNVVLVGEPGVGKSSIVYKLTCDIINGNCPEEFKNFLVLSLDVNSLIAGTMFRGQAEERFQDIIDFLQENPNVILFIDEIHMIVGAGSCSGEDKNDFSNALKPILAGDDAIVIGATTEEEYNQTFGMEGALRRRFRKLTVKEPKTTEVYAMLKDSIKQLEEFHGVKISKKMVDFIIFYSSCFNYETCNPDRSKDLIDLSMVTAKMDGKTRVDRISVMKNFAGNFEQFHNLPEEQIKATAYHEMGHYLVWRFSGRLTHKEIIAVSIIPAENYLGVNVFDTLDNFPITDNQFFIDSIAEALAGRVAEKTFCNCSYNSGASSDLQKVTKLAYDMVAKYGMRNNIGTNRIYLNNDQYQMQTEETINSINAEIERIIDTANKRAEDILKKHYELLKQLVEIISQRGMMSKAELESVVQNYLSTHGIQA